jgi:uncharacterized protein (DUF1330 family)
MAVYVIASLTIKDTVPSLEQARKWWGSPEYAEPKALPQATADSELVIVQGV